MIYNLCRRNRLRISIHNRKHLILDLTDLTCMPPGGSEVRNVFGAQYVQKTIVGYR